MSPDGITLNLIIRELTTLLQGRVERVYQPERQEIILIIRSSGQSRRLLLSAQADNARLHLTTADKDNPACPPLFCQVLRKHLEGARLTGIEQEGLDRVVRFTFNRLDESGVYRDLVLVSEVMGRHSNLILYDPATGTIIDGIRRYSHDLSRYREVLPGRPYLAAPPSRKRHPGELTEDDFKEMVLNGPLDRLVEERLFTCLAGMGPELCREVLYRANLEPRLKVNFCGEYELHAIWTALQGLLQPLLAGHSDPCIVYEGRQPVSCAPVSLTQYQGLRLERVATVNQMLDRYFAARTAAARFQQLQRHLTGIIKHEIERCSKKLAIQEQDINKAQEADIYRVQGEMLLAHPQLVKQGQSEAWIPNLYEPDAPLMRISLDPSLSAIQNAQRLFKKYDKARDSLKIVRKQAAHTKEELNYLAGVRTALEQAESMGELEEIQSELVETGYIKEKESVPKKKPSKQNQKNHPQINRLISRDGLEILYGRNNRQNDYLTMRLARESDLWLHVQNAPGSHVVVKRHPGEEIPLSTLEQAARLAAYFSDYRHSSKVAVDYTRRKNVTKPPGARPGFVLYRDYQTIMVEPEGPAGGTEDG